jgi:Transposase
MLTVVLARTVYNVLKENGYSTYKRTMKPGLKDKDKERRLKWCLDYEDWTLEDWKNVI